MKFNTQQFTAYKDNYNIYNLITKINKNYKLYLDQLSKTFVIVNSAKNNQICLNFSNFNQNILKSLQYSRVENSKNIFAEINNYNQNLQSKNKQKLKTETADKLIELTSSAKRLNHLTNNTIQKIIGADLC